MFIIEEMRAQFRYNLISIKAVFTGVIMSSIVFRIFNGEGAVIEVGKLTNAPVNTLWLYLILGMIFGVVGPLFNTFILRAQDMFQRIHGGNTTKWVLMGGCWVECAAYSGLSSRMPQAAGSDLFPLRRRGISAWVCCCLCLSPGLSRRYCASLPARPGGFFAPMLALGTLLGTTFGMAAEVGFPAYHLEAGTFAVAGMGALLAASLRAPLTGSCWCWR